VAAIWRWALLGLNICDKTQTGDTLGPAIARAAPATAPALTKFLLPLTPLHGDECGGFCQKMDCSPRRGETNFVHVLLKLLPNSFFESPRTPDRALFSKKEKCKQKGQKPLMFSADFLAPYQNGTVKRYQKTQAR
jgi:hypothetical protein